MKFAATNLRPIVGPGHADAARQARTAMALQLIERFVYDLGLLLAGLNPDLEAYVAPASALRLREAVRPAIGTGSTVRPDFGEYAQVTILGDILKSGSVMRVIVEFDDASTRIDADGYVVSRSSRCVRLRLLLDQDLAWVLDHRVDFV